jgi:hypothetical protein
MSKTGMLKNFSGLMDILNVLCILDRRKWNKAEKPINFDYPDVRYFGS